MYLTRRQLLEGSGATIALNAVPKSASGQGPAACPRSSDDFYFDELGLIVQKNCDGGDTAQREGMYWFGTWMWQHDLGLGKFGKVRTLNKFQKAISYLEVGKTGQFRRHPTQTQNGFNLPEKTSRDQLIPLIAAMGVHRDFQRLDRLRDRIQKKFYFVNTDWLVFFDEYMKRALDRDLQFDGWTDQNLLDAAVTLRFKELEERNDMDDVGDDLNLIIQLALAAVRRGERIKAIRARYSLNRPINYGVYLDQFRKAFPKALAASKEEMSESFKQGIKTFGWKPECTNVLGSLRWYFREESGGGPGMVTLYKPILDKYFAAPFADA